MKTTLFKSNVQALLLAVLFLCSLNLAAQHRILLVSGTEINGRVVEISDEQIRFVTGTDNEAPVRVLARAEVRCIIYPNGTMDQFGPQPRYGVAVPADTSDLIITPAKKFGGPRFGFTAISAGTTADHITGLGKNPFVTQFGWQFETRMFTIDNGPSGLVEFIPLIGGMEQGMFLPSANLLIGLRGGGKNAPELAVGPNLSLSGLGMVFAAGANFRSGKVNFPVNLAIVPSVGSKKETYDSNTGIATTRRVQTGWRITLTVGFNSRKK